MSKTPLAIKPLLFALSLCVGAVACTPGALAEPVQPSVRQPAPPAPDFQGIHRWINSPPLRMSQLRGQVVLVEFWTYACINCLHVQPYVNQWHQRYREQGLKVIGVHTPEYDYEHLTGNVQAAVERLGIGYPVAQDNDYATWNAYGNRFWPALYLIDRDGRIVYRHYGEGDYAQTEAMIRELLAQR